MDFNSFILALHSWVRWLVLLLALVVIIRGFMGWFGKKEWTGQDTGWVARFAMIMNIQFVLGLVLLFLSPNVQNALAQGMSAIMKDGYMRSLIIEHPLGMIAALALVHIGKSKARKAATAVQSHKKVAIFTLIALVIMLASIPWATSVAFRAF